MEGRRALAVLRVCAKARHFLYIPTSGRLVGFGVSSRVCGSRRGWVWSGCVTIDNPHAATPNESLVEDAVGRVIAFCD